MDALIRLMLLKENLEDPAIIDRMHRILVPREFTRLDDIADILFSTAEDLRSEEETAPVESPEDEAEPEKKFTPVAFHRACVERIEGHLHQSFVKHSRTTFATADQSQRLVCAVSREHLRSGQPFFWFAFHPHQRDFLAGSSSASIAFGCGSAANVLLIPFKDFEAWLDGFNTTVTDERTYWHIHITQHGKAFRLLRKAGHAPVDLTKYLVP